MLCDEIFGEENFIANFVWNSTKSITNPALVSVAHTYNLAYAKEKSVYDQNYRKNFKLPAILEGFSNPDNDPRGPWKADPFEAGGVRPNQMYPIKNPNTGEVFRPNKGNCWKNDLNKFKELIADNRIVFGKDGKGRPQRKRFIWEAEERGLTPNTWWDDVGTTTNGTMELKNILGEKLFNNPKPISLIRKILLLTSQKNSVILDFMAGSGTTGHAVLALNKEDDGNRQFILCTNNENNIATDVCYPRIQKAIKGYTTPKGDKIDGLGGNLKYFKTAFVKNSISRDNLKMRITRECTEMLCLREGIFDEVESTDDYRIFAQNNRVMGVYYSMERGGLASLKKELDTMQGEKILYCFTLDPLGLDKEDFADWQGVSLEAIPQPILDIYKDIYNL